MGNHSNYIVFKPRDNNERSNSVRKFASETRRAKKQEKSAEVNPEIIEVVSPH